MRTFYIFSINYNFYYLYRNNESELFFIIKDLSKLSSDDLVYATNIYYQINKNIDKFYIDKRIFIDLHKELFYKKIKDVHIYNDSYSNEVSFMEIKNNYIKIKSNKYYCTFFKILDPFNKNYFVCDFNNNDYFFLSSIKTLV